VKLPRDLSGRRLAQVLVRRWGYREVHRVGRHMILQTESPQHHRLSVPDHNPLRVGTLSAILRSVAEAKSVSHDEILALAKAGEEVW
jgi:predicted RNA binding protein YcfA (HicA-like mRNA interferase family)